MTKPTRAQRLDDAATALFAASALLDQVRLMIWDRENLTVTQLRLLGHLLQQEGLSTAELADRLYVTRRGINIRLEPRGRAAIESLRTELREYATGLMEDLSDAEIDAFISAVDRFVQAGRARRSRDLAAEAQQSD